MRRIAVFLVLLLLILTFNAYACVLPLPEPPAMDCSSNTEEPVRGTCDAFLELGPHSQVSPTHALQTFHLSSALPMSLLPDTFIPVVHVIEPPRNTITSIHLSIPITVLRI